MAQAKRCCIYIHNTIFLNLSFQGESGRDLQADSFFFLSPLAGLFRKALSIEL